jgi:hypothetical protein
MYPYARAHAGQAPAVPPPIAQILSPDAAPFDPTQTTPVPVADPFIGQVQVPAGTVTFPSMDVLNAIFAQIAQSSAVQAAQAAVTQDQQNLQAALAALASDQGNASSALAALGTDQQNLQAALTALGTDQQTLQAALAAVAADQQNALAAMGALNNDTASLLAAAIAQAQALVVAQAVVAQPPVPTAPAPVAQTGFFFGRQGGRGRPVAPLKRFSSFTAVAPASGNKLCSREVCHWNSSSGQLECINQYYLC